MSKNSAKSLSYLCTQTRELSWLRFNRRVLEEAADPTVPLLERLKFISIFTSNLDEFFMVRVGSLFDLSIMSPEKVDNKTGLDSRQQLGKIYEAVPGLIEMKQRIYAAVSAQLAEAGIRDLKPEEMTPEEAKYFEQYFRAKVHPMLSPQIVDSHHPFPLLANKALYIAASLRDKKGQQQSLGFVPVPASLPLFLPSPENPCRFVRMENLILQYAGRLFGSFKAEELCVLCVTRNADISFDEEKFEDTDGEDFRARMKKLLTKRARLAVVRLELSRPVGKEFLSQLKNRLNLEQRQIYTSPAPMNMKYVYQMIDSLPQGVRQPLLFAEYQPRWPEDLSPDYSIIEQIRQKDKLLFYPFDSVEPFLSLLREAAERPDVISIKITIYRLASSSKIARTLCRAAENGKEVTVLMELRARFDEANNISWASLLEEAGCRVIYGVEDYKCHSKVCLITLRRGDHPFYITQVGTGNYNEKTNAQYTDLSLMTASDTIGMDATVFFQNMLVGNLEGEYHQLLASPYGIKDKILELIDQQIAKGPEGYLCIKANALTERDVIDKLEEASRAGVEVQLILRGICCLVPGIPNHTENIHVTSIVGRYLEHARIYCFGRENPIYYISSADMMTRNLLRRVEIACPVNDPQIKEELAWILKTELEDNVKASFLLSDGSYSRKVNGLVPVSSQEVFMDQSSHWETPSLPRTSGPSLLERLKSLLHRGK